MGQKLFFAFRKSFSFILICFSGFKSVRLVLQWFSSSFLIVFSQTGSFLGGV